MKNEFSQSGCRSFYCFDRAKDIVMVCDSKPDRKGILNPQNFSDASLYFLCEDFDAQKHLVRDGDQFVLNEAFLLSRPVRSKEKKLPVSLSYACESYLFALLSEVNFSLDNKAYFKDSTTTGAQQTARVFKNICNELVKYHAEGRAYELLKQGKEALFENDYGTNVLKVHCCYRHYAGCEKQTDDLERYLCCGLQKQIGDEFDNGTDIVALCGISGIGKSIAARLYSQSNPAIHNVFLLDCVDISPASSLDSLMNDYLYINSKKVNDIESAMHALSCQDQSTLLILDNLNLLTDEFVKQLRKVRCPIIITSTLNEKTMSQLLYALKAPQLTFAIAISRSLYRQSSIIDLNRNECQKELAKTIFFKRIPYDKTIEDSFDRLMKRNDYHTRLCDDLSRYVENQCAIQGKTPSVILDELYNNDDAIFDNLLNALYQKYDSLSTKAKQLLGAIIEIDSHHTSISFLKKVFIDYDEKELVQLEKLNLVQRHNDVLQIHPVVLKALTHDGSPIVDYNESTSLAIWKEYFVNETGKPMMLFCVADELPRFRLKERIIRIRHDCRKLAQLIDQYTHTDRQKTAGIGSRVMPSGSYLDELLVNGKRYLMLYQNNKKEDPILLIKNDAGKLLFYSIRNNKCYPQFYPYEKPSEKCWILSTFGSVCDETEFPSSIVNRGEVQIPVRISEDDDHVMEIMNSFKPDGDYMSMQKLLTPLYEKAFLAFRNCPTNRHCRFFFELMAQKRYIFAIFYNTLPKDYAGAVSLMDYSYQLLQESIALHEYGLFQLSRKPMKKADFADPQLFRDYYYYGVNQYREKKYDEAVSSFREAMLNAEICFHKPNLDEDWDEHFSYLCSMLAQAMDKDCPKPTSQQAEEILSLYNQAAAHKKAVCDCHEYTKNQNVYQNHMAVYMLYRLNATNFLAKIHGDEQAIQNGYNEAGFIVSLLDLTKANKGDHSLLRRADHVLKYCNDRLNYELATSQNHFIMNKLARKGMDLIISDLRNTVLNPNLVDYFRSTYRRAMKIINPDFDDGLPF